MSLPRVEVCDPSLEGDEIRSGLRQHEFHIVRRDVEDFFRSSVAVAIVLAGDAEGALAALAHMRGEEPLTRIPVVLVGHPEGDSFGEQQALLLGAHAYFKRPVDIAALAACIKAMLDGSHAIAIAPTSSRPVTTFVGTITGRELTLQLAGSEPPPPYAGAAVAQAGALEDSGLAPAPRGPIADLSPRLRALFEEADRRVFPSSAPLDITFPASDESPDDLVPAELLDHVVNALDMPEEDALESLTFVGSSPVMSSEVTSGKSSATKRRSQFPTDAESRAPDFGSLPPRVETDGAAVARERRVRRAVPDLRGVLPQRRTSESVSEVDSSLFRDAQTSSLPSEGSFTDAGLVPIVLRLIDERANGVLAIAAAGEFEVRLLFEAGSIRAMSAGVAMHVIETLRNERGWDEAVADEGEALAALKRRVQAKLFSSFDLEKRIARSRFLIFCDALFAQGGSFTWGSVSARDADLAAQTRKPFAIAPLALVLEASRRKLTNARAISLLGHGTVRIQHDNPRARSVLALLPAEIDTWLSENTPRPLDLLLAESPQEEGVAGILYLLSLVDALSVEREVSVELSSEDARARVNEILLRAKELADDGDYFALLGISRDVTAREVAGAYEERARTFRALPLADLGLLRHESARDLMLDALRDAYDVLANDSVRIDYANALFGVKDTSAELIALRPNE
ncbi:MAG: hypothetical protein IPK60_17210 [Sandaracinaceae bacterium]|nr:hypothetical protein [Sandaracinaceae bacterium]